MNNKKRLCEIKKYNKKLNLARADIMNMRGILYLRPRKREMRCTICT